MSRRDTPTISFHLYDQTYEMTLDKFYQICKITNEGLEPHTRYFEDFMFEETMGESRGDLKLPVYIFPFCVTFHRHLTQNLKTLATQNLMELVR